MSEIVEDFNILDEAVNEKSYSKANITMTAEEMNKPIDEPSFVPPPMEEQEPKPKESAESIREKKNPEPFNPEMKYLPKKEQNMAAEKMADLIFVGYKKLHDLANAGLQISPKKLTKLQNEGKINLNAMISYDYGTEILARDFFQEYNDSMKDFFKLDQDFIDDVKPPLVRILQKKGIGMTDDTYVIFRLVEDAGTKAFMFIQQKRQIAEILKTIGTATTSENATYAPPPPPPPQPSYNDFGNANDASVQSQEQSYENEPAAPEYQNAEVVVGEEHNEPISPDAIILPKKETRKGARGRIPKNK